MTSDSYAAWVKQFDTIGARERIVFRRDLRTLPRHPLISIVMPVYNPDLVHLSSAIDSVRAQIYENWELCIADDASTNPLVAQTLKEHAAADSRIKLTFRESNGHIAACSNSALGLVTGEWVALLDQDDLLPEHALGVVAATIENHPEAGLIYSDEDKIDESGMRCRPFFKPDWNPELLLGQNYISHLGIYRRALLREIGGFREGYEGSQDYDLALRCVEKLAPAQIRHIPRVPLSLADGRRKRCSRGRSKAVRAESSAACDRRLFAAQKCRRQGGCVPRESGMVSCYLRFAVTLALRLHRYPDAQSTDALATVSHRASAKRQTMRQSRL